MDIKQTVSQEQMLQEIYENTRKTKNYMKWQLIITVALVVVPIIAMAFVVPFALKSLTSTYGAAGFLE
jgi:nitrate reductase NapE component